MMLRCVFVNWLTAAFGKFCSLSNFPSSCMLRIAAGTTIEMRLGMKISVSTPCVVITPLIQSMMVVTSPIGEKAPPELAAIITSAA